MSGVEIQVQESRLQGLASSLDGVYTKLSGIKTEFDHVGKSFKARFKYANKIDARFVAILGDEELERGEVKLKDMETGDEGYVPIAALGNRVQQILR